MSSTSQGLANIIKICYEPQVQDLSLLGDIMNNNHRASIEAMLAACSVALKRKDGLDLRGNNQVRVMSVQVALRSMA